MITIRLCPLADPVQQRNIINLFFDDFVYRIDSWLMALQPTKRGKIPWRFIIKKNKPAISITFVRYEDALAFKLAFGV